MKIKKLIITVFVLMVILILALVGGGVYTCNKFARPMLIRQKPGADYREAEAVILKVHRTGLVVENRTGLDLLLEIHPVAGSPFQVRIERAFYSPDVYLYQPGARLKVRYDPNDINQIAIISAPLPDSDR